MMDNNIYKKSVFIVLFILTAGCLWYFQSLIVVNVPFWDDFHGIMLPVYDILSDIPLHDKLIALFSQNNEHRIMNDRLFMWMVYLIKGNFDMRFLALIGFVNLIGIIWIFAKVFQHEKISVYYLLPTLFFLFQPQYFESLQSLMVPFQNFSVIFYAFLAFYLATYGKGSAALILAFLFAALSFYTHGNGIFVIVIGAMILFVKGGRKQFFVWSAFSVLVILSYFYGYKKPDWSTSSSPLERPVESFFYFFEFLGSFSLSYVEMSTSLLNSFLKKGLPTIVGLGIFGWFVFLFFRIYPVRLKLSQIQSQIKRLGESKFEIFILACITFFLFTAFILALHRTGFPMMSRYTINSSLFISLVYIFAYYHAKPKFKRIWFSVFMFISVTYLCLGYYNNWDISSYKRKLAVTDGMNWERNHMWTNQYFSSEHTLELSHLLDKPYDAKMYFFPANVLDKVDAMPFENKIIPIEVEEDGLLRTIVDHANIPLSLDAESGIYYIFKSPENQFIAPGFQMKNGFLKFLSKRSYYSGVIKTGIGIHLIPNATYDIIRVEYDGKGSLKKYKTDKSIINTGYGSDV